MKIAFTTSGRSLYDQVDIRFGRTKGILVFDDQTGATDYIDNTANASLTQGAGTAAATLIAEKGIQVLVTGKVGPKAAQVLKDGNVKVYGGIGYGSIREVYDQYKKGLLTEQPL